MVNAKGEESGFTFYVCVGWPLSCNVGLTPDSALMERRVIPYSRFDCTLVRYGWDTDRCTSHESAVAVEATMRPLWMKVSVVHQLHHHRLMKDSRRTSSHYLGVRFIFHVRDVIKVGNGEGFRLMTIVFRSFC